MMGNTESLDKIRKCAKGNLTAEDLKNKFFYNRTIEKDCVAVGRRVGQNGELSGNMGVG